MRTIPFVAGLSIVAMQTQTAFAESVSCPLSSKHPVCRATYAANPAGTVGRDQRQSTGTATVNGKKVQWMCAGGSATRPRQCSY